MEKQKICEKERKKLEELRCKQEEDSIAEYNAMVEFKLNDDGESYTLIKCALDENWIRIGDTHNGLPVTSIGDRAFLQRCFLMNVTIPNSVTSIGSHAFANCMGLRSIAIPSSVTSIGRYAFLCCEGLKTIAIPSSVMSISGDAFTWCVSLTDISVDENNARYKSIDGNIYTKDGKNLIYYAAGKTDRTFVVPNGVTSIGNGAFNACRNLTSIFIPSSVTSIDDYAFSCCENLTSIVIPSSVTSIGRSAFIGCKNLTSIVIPSSVTSIGDNVFEDSKNLEYIYCFDNFRKIEGIRKAGIKRRAVLYYRETKPKIKLFRRYWHIDDGCAMEWW